MASGWSELGAALAGNGARQRALYEQGATGVARLEGLLSEARRRRDEEAGYAGITPEAISAANANPSQASDLLAAMFHAGVDPQRLSGYQREALGTTIQQDAYDRARNGAQVADINPLLAVFNGKPVEVSTVKDGVSYNAYATPDQNTFTPTQVGLAEIMQKGAEADAAKARAASSFATAAKTRSEIGMPSSGASTGAPSPTNYGKPPSGYRFDADGNLKPIPGGPADKPKADPNATRPAAPLSAEARAKLGLLDAAQESLDKYIAAAFKMDEQGNLVYDPTSAVLGPSKAFLNDAINGTLRYESGAGVPDYELAAARDRYAPSVMNRDATNAAKIQLLRDKIKLQRDTLVNGPQGDPSAAAAAPSSGSRLQPGHVEDGYRFLGGEPSDPKNWEKL